jgi:hypothetical protein
MCDYSLEFYGSQPAREGERYVTARFPSGTIGLIAPDRPGTAICLACDTRLQVDHIPAEMRKSLALTEREGAVFVRLDTGSYRDGLRFDNGAEVSLQRFPTGVGVTVSALLEAQMPLDLEQRESLYLGA